MMRTQSPVAAWSPLSDLIAETMGLHFPPERWDDLKRGVAGAAQEFGFDDAATCVDWLLSAPLTQVQQQVLAAHLTIGETYFFREPKTLDALAGNILPKLIHARRGGEQRLRIWSAACCTGEEAYSLAILLHQLLPDLQRWHVTITATDINARFLRTAAAGVYREWSFRSTPPGVKKRYFEAIAEGRYAVLPEIRKLVSFEHLNLVEDVYPSLATNTNAMDLILCRNALMYFTPPQMRKAVGRLHHALVEGGWLAVAASEASHTYFPQFLAVNFPGTILFQRSGAGLASEQRPAPLSDTAGPVASASETISSRAQTLPAPVTQSAPTTLSEEPVLVETPPTPLAAAESLYQQGRYAEAEATLAAFAERPAGLPAFSLLARTLANQGKLADALAWCDRWVAADKVDAAGHYLRAVILMEQGNSTEVRSSLQRAIYLTPDFVLAHFALGNLARAGGKLDDARKHFVNALHLLRSSQPGDLVPEAEGLTAGRLTETLQSMIAAASAP